jgi:hypothetical protein
MAKRSFTFKNIRQEFKNIKHGDIFDREGLRREITQKRDTLKRTLTERRDALTRGLRSDTGGGVALSRSHKKVAVAGVATVGAAALAVSLAPHNAEAGSHVSPTAYSASSQHKDVQGSGQHQVSVADAEQKAVGSGSAHKSGSGSGHHNNAHPATSHPVYANNLDGWIRHSLAVMHQHHIPGSYNGLYRNIIRESSGNPSAINLYDINAQHGIPSKGLLQVIPPTFQRYHVAGTSWNIYDPVANITAAANYAADRYGSMDNVNSAY